MLVQYGVDVELALFTLHRMDTTHKHYTSTTGATREVLTHFAGGTVLQHPTTTNYDHCNTHQTNLTWSFDSKRLSHRISKFTSGPFPILDFSIPTGIQSSVNFARESQ